MVVLFEVMIWGFDDDGSEVLARWKEGGGLELKDGEEGGRDGEDGKAVGMESENTVRGGGQRRSI